MNGHTALAMPSPSMEKTMKLKYLVTAVAIELSTLTISACQSGPSYDNRAAYGSNDYGGGNSRGGNSGGGSSGY